jgi:Fe-S-cluster containining protein
VILNEHERLIQRVNAEVSRLERLHRSQLRCGPGCSSCCIGTLAISKLESYMIWNALQSMEPEINKWLMERKIQLSNQCQFLQNDICLIYRNRPMICRTHGLPILFITDHDTFIDACRLNFTDIHEDNYFIESNILDMGPFNGELAKLDKQFCERVIGMKWIPEDRVPLSCIMEAYVHANGQP